MAPQTVSAEGRRRGALWPYESELTASSLLGEAAQSLWVRPQKRHTVGYQSTRRDGRAASRMNRLAGTRPASLGRRGASAKSETSDGSLLEVPVAAPGAAGLVMTVMYGPRALEPNCFRTPPRLAVQLTNGSVRMRRINTATVFATGHRLGASFADENGWARCMPG